MSNQYCKMSPRQISSKGIWIIFIIFIIAGFTFQSWGVSQEYFEYRTSSFAAIRDYPEKDVEVPAIVTCFRIDNKLTVGGKAASQLFTGQKNYLNDKDDIWQVVSAVAMLPPNETLKYSTRKFITRNRHCLFLKVHNRLSMKEVESSGHNPVQPFLYKYKQRPTTIHSHYVHGKGKQQCQPKWVYVKVVTDESSLANPRNRELLREMCTKNVLYYFFGLTYSSLMNVKLPPPYDTNCLDYRKQGPYLSSHDCYDECLKEKMSKWNIIPGMTLIDRERYKRSNLSILSGSVLESKDYVFTFLSKTEPCDVCKLEPNSPKSKKEGERIRQLQSEWKNAKSPCRKSCSRPDCVSEDISPQIAFMEEFRKGNANLSDIYIKLLTSYQPTIHVSSAPQQQLIDYIIYMCSMLSFWLGFCPLTLIKVIVKKLHLINKNMKVDKGLLEKRVRRLEILFAVFKERPLNSRSPFSRTYTVAR